MQTQTIKLDLLTKAPTDPIVTRYKESGRVVRATVYNSESGEDVTIAGTWGVKLQLYKPDGNFIVKTLTPADGGVDIEFDEQMTAAPGVGFLDLKLTPPEGDIITCHARVMVDTPVYNDQVIESVSMVDGYIFPDDFQLKLTAGANITITEDNVISSTGGGGGGTGDYQDLINKPKINNVILSGNKTTAQLGLPTKTSDLTNDSGFITSAVNDLINYYKRSETYTKAEVNSLLASLSSLNLEVVAVLPDHDISTTTIYLVPKDVPGTDDVYDEYVYINNSWEKIGSTAADLSNYYTKAQADTLLSGKVDKVTGKGLSTNDFTNADVTKLNGIEAGAEVNVQADWNQTNVDADDYIKNKPSIGVYTAGNGIDITNNQISVTNLVLNHISENTEHIESLNQNLTAMKSIHLSGNAYCLAQSNGNIAFTLPLCGDYSQVTLNKNSNIAAAIYGLTSATGCTLTVNSATIETKTLRIYFTPSVTLSTYTPAAKGFLLNISEDLTATLS